MDHTLENRVESCLKKPVFVIDLLPERVPQGSRGQYFSIENYWYDSKTVKKLGGKFFRILLKLNCYCDLDVCLGDEAVRNPEPAKMQAMIRTCRERKRETLWVLVNEDEAMIMLCGDDLFLSVYGPDEKLQQLLGQLSLAEGLFFWDASQE